MREKEKHCELHRKRSTKITEPHLQFWKRSLMKLESSAGFPGVPSDGTRRISGCSPNQHRRSVPKCDKLSSAA